MCHSLSRDKGTRAHMPSLLLNQTTSKFSMAESQINPDLHFLVCMGKRVRRAHFCVLPSLNFVILLLSKDINYSSGIKTQQNVLQNDFMNYHNLAEQ